MTEFDGSFTPSTDAGVDRADTTDLEKTNGTSSLDAYLRFLNTEVLPASVAEMPDELTLPLGLSQHLNALTVDTLDDQQERGQLIEWDASSNDFSYGGLSTGKVGKGSNKRSMSEWLKTTRFAKERPLVDFHTHPSDVGHGTFFSRTDLANFFHQRVPPYMYMVGTPEGGYALLSAQQYGRKGIRESHDLALEVVPFRDSPPTLITEKAQKLSKMGLATYSWTRVGNTSQGSGISLKRYKTT